MSQPENHDEIPDESSDALPLSGIEVHVDGDDDFDEEEFTLETLSEAYAEVVEANEDGSLADEGTRGADEALGAAGDTPVANEDSDPVATIDDDSACPISPESIVESILFIGSPSDVKLTGKKIASILRDVSPKEVGQIVKSLNKGYQKRDAAFRIHAEKGVYRMVLDDGLSGFQNEYFGRNRQARLPQAAIDVMAVVAYHQPASRDDVDRIRGRSSGGVLNQMVKRRLLTFEKSDDRPVRKMYSTTERFLDLFGLEDLEDLPQSHDMADLEELAD